MKLAQLIGAFFVAAVGHHLINTAAEAGHAKIKEITAPDEPEQDEEKEDPKDDK